MRASALRGGVACLAALGFASIAHAGAPAPERPPVPAEVALEDPPIFPLSEVKRGVKGHGYTVFASAKGPERFGFEVLGVMRDYLGPGEDLIIAQLTGANIERTGVIAGMSGSPAYVDGRLMGAVGYRFGSFTKDPIAGITPIERMLTAKNRPTARGGRRGSRVGGSPSAMLDGLGQPEPIAVPISASSLHPEVARTFHDVLLERGYGPLVPTAGATAFRPGKDVPAGSTRFFAGGPIAGVLVDGDVLMAGIGTVTWVKGDRFLAFGHPFLGTGVSEMPVANAEILTTVASMSASWKMGQVTTPVGRLTDDRLHAIAGTMGETPRTIPLDVTLDMQGPRTDKDAQEKLAFRIIRHPTDTVLFAAIVLAQVLSDRVGAELGGTLDVSGEMKLSSGHTVRFAERLSADAGSLHLGAALATLGELSAVVDTGLLDVEPTTISLAVKRREAVAIDTVAAVDVIDPLVVGRTGSVRVRVIPWDGPAREVLVPVRLPRGFAPGTYGLVVAGPGRALRTEREGGLIALPDTFDELLATRAQRPPPGSLSVYLVRDTPQTRLMGVVAEELPLSLEGLLEDRGGLSRSRTEATVRRVARLATPATVEGMARAKVTVAPDPSPEESR